MRRRMVMFQERKQNKPSEKELKRERSNLPNEEFEVNGHKNAPVCLPACFSAETSQVREDWLSTAQNAERKKPTTKNDLQAKLSFQIEGEIKSFTDKQKLKVFITPIQALQEMLEVCIYWLFLLFLIGCIILSFHSLIIFIVYFTLYKK